jgi:hypothetical protein
MGGRLRQAHDTADRCVMLCRGQGRTAKRLGCRTLDGGGMAVFQAVEAFRLFTGITPDAERMLRHFAWLGPG